jgi:hypothetical protein
MGVDDNTDDENNGLEQKIDSRLKALDEKIKKINAKEATTVQKNEKWKVKQKAVNAKNKIAESKLKKYEGRLEMIKKRKADHQVEKNALEVLSNVYKRKTPKIVPEAQEEVIEYRTYGDGVDGQ